MSKMSVMSSGTVWSCAKMWKKSSIDMYIQTFIVYWENTLSWKPALYKALEPKGVAQAIIEEAPGFSNNGIAC